VIATEVAQAQLSRLSWMPGYPGDQVRLYALTRALVECARSLGHAATTIDELAKRGFCPTADQITDQAWASLSGGERHACGTCYGGGWTHIERRVSASGITPAIYEGAAPCPTCRPPAAPDDAPPTKPRGRKPQQATRNMFGGDA
jgi:hypothetical protein